MRHLMGMWGSLARGAGSSWRPFAGGPFWNEYRAVIFSDGGPSGRKSYEVYIDGDLVATRGSLREAKEHVDARMGPADWKVKRMDPIEVDHYFFGPTTEFTSPMTMWVADTFASFDRAAHLEHDR